MIDLLTITNSPALAAACDALPGMRLFVDLERNGKAERQAGRDTFISSHQLSDVGRVKAQLQHTRLMVRVNPYDPAQAAAADGLCMRGALDRALDPGTGGVARPEHFSLLALARALKRLEVSARLHPDDARLALAAGAARA